MLEKLEVLKKGLDRAVKPGGLFTLEEASLLLTNYVQLKQHLQSENENSQPERELKQKSK